MLRNVTVSGFPLALRARSVIIIMLARIVTVCYSLTRASEASGFSTVQRLLRMAAHLCACDRMLRLLAFGADPCYINNEGEFSSQTVHSLSIIYESISSYHSLQRILPR